MFSDLMTLQIKEECVSQRHERKAVHYPAWLVGSWNTFPETSVEKESSLPSISSFCLVFPAQNLGMQDTKYPGWEDIGTGRLSSTWKTIFQS